MARKSGRSVTPRNPYVVPAKHRQAGAIDDRREPRGGARNDERDWLDEWTWIEEDPAPNEEEPPSGRKPK